MFTTIRGLFLALFVVAVLAACSATAAGPGVATLESQAPGAAPSASPSMSPEDALVAYAECMREHGIDMPDPTYEEGENGEVRIGIGGGPGARDDVDKEEFIEAETACRHLMTAVMPAGRGEMSPEDEEKLLQFARCMREHGIDMPDPNANGGMVFEVGPSEGGEGGKAGIDPNDADFQAAQEACGDLLPGKIGGGGPSTNEVGPGPAGDKDVPDTQVAP
jgi:hypothetical protein